MTLREFAKTVNEALILNESGTHTDADTVAIIREALAEEKGD